MGHSVEDGEKALENLSEDASRDNVQEEALCTAGGAVAEKYEGSLDDGVVEAQKKITGEQTVSNLIDSAKTPPDKSKEQPASTSVLEDLNETLHHTFNSPRADSGSAPIGFIRALTITNFKSYAGTHTVDPLYRFMSVVGPNASGKSNLLDALLFVLGADHRQLRLRLSLAELVAPGAQSAAVRIDLCDGSSIQRSVNVRSGDELLINRKKMCIRSSSEYRKALEQAYPLLGRVCNFVLTQSAALSLSNINFLAIIEDSASENSLEARKEYSAANKASRVASQRLCECIAEKRRAQLAERGAQADLAARDEFIRLSEKRDQLESKIRMAELQELKIKLEEIEGRENALLTCTTKEKACFENKHGYVLSLRREAAALQREFFEREAKCIRRAAASYHTGTDQHPALSHTLEMEQRRREFEEADALVKRIETELCKLSSSSAYSSSQYNAGDKNSDKAGEETSGERTGDEQSGYGLRTSSPYNTIATSIATSSRKKEADGVDVEDLERILSERTREEREKLSALLMENYDAVAKRRELQTRLRELRARCSQMRREEQFETQKKAAEQSKRRALEEELERLRSRADLAEAGKRLEEIVEEEKRKKAEMALTVRNILMSRGKKSDAVKRAAEGVLVNNVLSKMFAGVYGRVVDLVRPASARYAAAFAAAVSPFENSVVVESSSVALDCVRYLREAKAGRLSFVVLSRLQQGDKQENKAVVSKAGDFSETSKGASAVKLEQCLVAEPKFWKVVKMISGQAVVVEDAKTARAVINEKGVRRAITIGGVSITSDGVVSSVKQPDQVYQNASLEALLERRSQIASDLRTLAARRSAFSELEVVLQRMAEIEAELGEKNDRFVKDKAVSLGASGGVEGEKSCDIQATEAEIKSTEEKLREVERELAEFSVHEARLRAAIGAKEREVLCSSLKAAGVLTLAELRRKRMLETRLVAAREAACRAAEKLRMLSEVSAAVAQRRVEDKNNEGDEEKTLRKLEAKLCAVRERLKRESSELEKLSEARSSAEKQILECRLERVRIEEEVRALASVLSASEGIDASEMDETKTVSELRCELAEVNNRLSELCSAVEMSRISSSAVELARRVAEAEGALAAAKGAADSARERFVAVKRARMARFSELFDKVSRTIGEIYCSLVEEQNSEDKLPGFPSSARPFSRAQLLCEGDPFEGAIKYFVVPPGKNFTEFSDLSGGERIMAYMAFLIALGKAIGVPLFLFDEVDAALDRVHVEKLSRYVATGASSAQFIVVSLKPQFFRHSDALIGVYRPGNSANSSILTLRLK